MPLDPTFIGRTYPPTEAYEVLPEKIREFADAAGDANPAYHDPAAAQKLGHRDVIAPPTFATIVSLDAAQRVVKDPALGLDWNRVVHGEQKFAFDRPITAGDKLATASTVESIKSLAGNDIITIRSDISDAAGVHLVSAWTTLVARAPEEA
jgi:acyl dehydratase